VQVPGVLLVVGPDHRSVVGHLAAFPGGAVGDLPGGPQQAAVLLHLQRFLVGELAPHHPAAAQDVGVHRGQPRVDGRRDVEQLGHRLGLPD
jgi:hypothetical protein